MIRNRRVNRIIARCQRAAASVGRALSAVWTRSLQLRVVVSTLALSFVVILVLGFLLISQITGRLLDAKQAAATEEVDRARAAVERVLSASDTSSSTQNLLARARALLSDVDAETGQSSSGVGTFDSVLVIGDRESVDAGLSVGPIDEVPAALRDMVSGGQVAYQYTSTVQDGERVAALVIGTPVESPLQKLELFLVFPLSGEENTVALVRGTLFAGGVVLLGLLAAIAWLVSRQVVAPLRAASAVAVRFADGDLDERMPVHGEDEFARLAVSFNDMAESLSKQITHLEEFGGLQRQFTSDVSHELRTPLTTVKMAADVLYDGSDELDPMQRRSVELLAK